MKLVLLSDTHGMHRELTIPECDIILCGGDITMNGQLPVVYDFINWLANQPARHKVFVAGNHDGSFQDSRKNKIREVLIQHPDVYYLEDDSVILEGIKIYGSPWQPWFYDWAFNVKRGFEIAQKWAKIPSDTDILLLHGPPLGYGDRVDSGDRVGCADLLEKVLEIQPNLVIFGHIHSGWGMYHVTAKTTAFNVAVVDESYTVVRDPVVINYNDFTENAVYLQNNK